MTNSTSVGRGGLRLRRSILCVSTILCTGLAPIFVATPAMAQLAPPAPVRASIDGNGVDLFLGTMNVDASVLSAGNGEQAMSYYKLNRGSGWGDNVIATMNASGSVYTVTFGAKSSRFTKSGTVYTSTEGEGATLSLSGSIYTFVASDGTVAHFDAALSDVAPYYSSAGRVTDITRPNGQTLTFNYFHLTYCAGARLGQCIYAESYRLQTVTSNSGYSLAFQYEIDTLSSSSVVPPPVRAKWGTVTGAALSNTAISGSSSRSQTFATSTSGSDTFLTVTDPMTRVTQYRSIAAGVAGVKRSGKSAEDITLTYDGSNKVASITTPVGTTTYAYSDASGIRTTTVTDPGGHATVYTFDIASQRMLSATNPLSQKTEWQYDSAGRVTKVIAPELNYTQYTYDARGNVAETRVVKKTGTGTDDIVTTAGYDTSCSNVATCNRPNWTTDAKGNQTDYTYDSTTGNLLTVTAPAPVTSGTRPKTTYTYATSGGVSLVSSVSSCQTTASCVGAADEVKSTVSYNSNLLPTTISKGAGDGSLTATTTIAYDDVGNRSIVDGPLSGTADTTTYRYDANREVVGVIGADPDGGGSLKRRATRTTYNDRGIATTVEAGTVNGTSDSDWAGFTSLQQVTVTLDDADRKTKVVTTAGGTTYSVAQYSYDIDGRLDCTALRMKSSTWTSLPTSACTATTGSGDDDRITKRTYDIADRVTKSTSAYGTSIASDDFSAGYSDNGQVTSLIDAEGNKTSFDYDLFDRLTKTKYPSTTKGAGTSSSSDYEELTYDANSNVTNRRLRDGNSIAYTYDYLDRLTYKNLPGSELDVTYSYDLIGRVLSASTSAQTLTFGYDALGRNLTQSGPLGTVSYQYDIAGRRTRLTWPDTFYVTYDYDVVGEMSAIKESGSTTLAGFTYDDLGRRTSLTRGNGVTTTYAYDAGSRMTSLDQNLSGTSGDLTLTFGYNNAGQISSTTRSNNAYSWTGATNVNRSYTSNGLNQYSAAGGTSFVFDTRGNLTSSGINTYTYSSENLLLTGPNSANLSYDPALRLYQSSSASVIARRFLYDGALAIATYDTSGTMLRREIPGSGADEILVEYKINSGAKNWKIADERGSVITVTDASGASVGVNTYDEYGIPGVSNTGLNQYTGQIYLPEIGMYYYKARMYSPTLGRFMQTDPIGYNDGMNWYNYVSGDPVNAKDPTGLEIVINGSRCVWTCITDRDQIERFLDALRNLNTGQSDDNSGEIVITGTRLAKDKKDPSPPGKIPCPSVPGSRPIGSHGRAWTAFFDPRGAIIALSVRDMAIKATAARFGGSGMETDNQTDAFRHFYGSFLLTRLIGPERATAILNANEVDGDQGMDSAMDTYNNAVGTMMAQDSRWSGRSVEDAANAALTSGCLVTHP